MKIQQELNIRLSRKGTYTNRYTLKECFNSFTGAFFISKSRLEKFVIDMIAFRKNDKIYEDHEIMDNVLCFLQESEKAYKNRISRIDKYQYKIYFASLILSIVSLSAYYIHTTLYKQWVYTDQIGIGDNIFILLAMIGVVCMPLSILMSSVREFSIVKLKHLSTVLSLFIEEMICFDNNLLEMQLLKSIKLLEKAQVIKKTSNEEFSAIYETVNLIKLTSPVVDIKLDNQSKLLRLFAALVLLGVFELCVEQKTFAEVVSKNIRTNGDIFSDDSCYKQFNRFSKFSPNAILGNIQADFPNIPLIHSLSGIDKELIGC